LNDGNPVRIFGGARLTGRMGKWDIGNESITRLLKEKFNLGLFENPYVDVDAAVKIVGNAEFQKKADLALRKSIVLLRNEALVLPLKKGTKVYFETC